MANSKRWRDVPRRLATWDYGWDGAYFITICTEGGIHFFGNIEPMDAEHTKGEMTLSSTGRQASRYWQMIPEKFPYAELGAFVVMPNHFHGIVIINKADRSFEKTPTPQSSTQAGGATGQHNPMLHDNLSRIIRWYKGRVTFEARKTKPTFGWQSRFYDRIIRSGEAFEEITRYIEENPNEWVREIWSQRRKV